MRIIVTTVYDNMTSAEIANYIESLRKTNFPEQYVRDLESKGQTWHMSKCPDPESNMMATTTMRIVQ